MCGESMVLTTRPEEQRIPGTIEIHVVEVREWICRECDYFEEVTGDGLEKQA